MIRVCRQSLASCRASPAAANANRLFREHGETTRLRRPHTRL